MTSIRELRKLKSIRDDLLTEFHLLYSIIILNLFRSIVLSIINVYSIEYISPEELVIMSLRDFKFGSLLRIIDSLPDDVDNILDKLKKQE